jgi:hypothetical protein
MLHWPLTGARLLTNTGRDFLRRVALVIGGQEEPGWRGFALPDSDCGTPAACDAYLFG